LAGGDIVLVTGASSGFGKLTASFLAERGYVVFGTSRKAPGGSRDSFEMVQLGITSDQSVKESVSTILQKAGRIDVLVNNAGQAQTGGLEETSIEEAKAHFDSNFFGAVRMVNAVLPDMRRRRRGGIINLASLAATFPVPFEGYYAAAKGADPKEVAETIVEIIERPSPALHYAVGKEKSSLLLKRVLPHSVLESLTRRHWRLDR